ncbi:hypothetical protein [Endozoicomonas sp. Mp262]|uniref:hypothetical protein n=1 Tax=Endozoicomonas sp. Mp262 TaxID=2919499 RepID=UPI0021D825C3
MVTLLIKKLKLPSLTGLVGLLVSALFLTGCRSATEFDVQSLAKTDIDMVADANILAIENLLQELTVKLYSRNPRELRKIPGQSLEDRQQQLFLTASTFAFEELGYQRSVDAMLLAFDPEFEGDRVFALMVGLTTMLDDAYDNQREFFITSKLDQQKLYNSARNIEVLIWRLNQRRDEKGGLYLLTNATSGAINLSFERLFGKLIARQDMMATLVAQKTNRTINRVVQGLATMAFVPI